MADLFVRSAAGKSSVSVVATYKYIELSGVLAAQKLRYSNKTFRWQRPGRESGTWLWRLDGVSPGLYRLPELVGANRVFVCEGEKAVDLLWSVGIPATCPPCGASMWLPAWSRDLQVVGCHEVIVLPDADPAGNRHAEHLAAITHAEVGAGITIKVVPLPGLQRGADVFDWLTEGRTSKDLEIVVSRATAWLPGASEQARLDRKRELNRERQRRLRLRRRMEVVRHGVNVPRALEVA